LSEGQHVKVKVIQTDEKGRVRLSAKALLNEGGAGAAPAEPTPQ
jgi:polyribonucleotide nucleotidyltransferase